MVGAARIELGTTPEWMVRNGIIVDPQPCWSLLWKSSQKIARPLRSGCPFCFMSLAAPPPPQEIRTQGVHEPNFRYLLAGRSIVTTVAQSYAALLANFAHRFPLRKGGVELAQP